MSEVSIVCCFRGREAIKNDFVVHVTKMYPMAEIVLVQQVDNKKFLRGQLFNVGFNYVTSNVVVFSDVDLRFLSPIDFVALEEKFKSPYYPYYTIKHCRLDSVGQYRIYGTRAWQNCNGGMYVCTQAQYKAINGHSNLYLGHSYEDTDFRLRAKPARENNTILHVTHPKSEQATDVKRNKYVFEHREEVDIQEDGLKQLVYNIVTITEPFPLVKQIDVNNITVCAGFKYKHYLKESF